MQEVSVAGYFAGSGLVAAPHMDDEVLACGGTLALLPNKADWHVVYASDGRGSPEPVAPWRDKVADDLGAVRQEEARAAMSCLGIPEANLHFLDLPDGRLARHEAELGQAVSRLIADLQPDHVLVPFRYDRHSDHLALNRAVTRLAHSGAYKKALTEYFVYYRWRMLPGGDVRHYLRRNLVQKVAISAASSQKRAALGCFKSQTTRYYPWQVRPTLSAELLDEVCGEPELFLRYDPALPGAAIFARAVPWIRLAHRLEPFLKKRKDRLLNRGASLRLAGRANASPSEQNVRATEGPIRVVMFGSGPALDPDVKEFLSRLEAHPDIALLGAFCQSQGQSPGDVARDLWRRRRWLAAPLLALHLAGRLRRAIGRSDGERALDQRLAQMADRLHFVPNIHDEAVLEQVRALRPDLGLVYGSPILKAALFEIPALGTLGIHHGQAPKYRGKKTTFWAMYNGEPCAGVMIQKINAGLDTGQIVNSGEVIAVGRAYRSVWNELVALGLDLYLRSILEVRSGTAQYRPQEGPKGRLYRDPGPGDIGRFWLRQMERRLRRRTRTESGAESSL